MKANRFLWISWVPFLASAISEWIFDFDLPLTPAVWLLVAGITSFATTTQAALTTNKWAVAFNGGGKWESASSWDHGVPSLNHSVNLLVPVNTLDTVATADAATVASNVINGCLTVSNLVVAGGGGIIPPTATLSLSNMNATPGNASLFIDDTLTISSHGVVSITNSAMKVAGQFVDNGSLILNTGTLTSGTNFIGNGGVGQMTVSNGTWQAVVAEIPNAEFVTPNGGVGTLTIAGGTSSFDIGLAVGSIGTGTVWVTGGQLLGGMDIGGSNFVGVGTGQVTVSNGTWQSSVLITTVGDSWQGTLTIAGGTVTMSAPGTGDAMFVGYNPTGNGVVWMTGGKLDIPGMVSLGRNSGHGRMVVSNGIFSCAVMNVGANIAFAETGHDSGTFTVAGGTSTISSNLYIGNRFCAGIAVVNVVGGSLFVTNAAHNATLEIRSGTVTLSSGTLVVDRLVVTNYCGHFVHLGGTLVITSTNLLASADADGDGLPNDWELQHGFDPFDPITGVEDSDGDGLDNYAEYLAGTDPHDLGDPFRITAFARESNNLRITWQYVPPPANDFGHCVVEASPSVTGTWNAVSSTITLPSGFFDILSTNYLDVGGATNSPARFYRVRLVP